MSVRGFLQFHSRPLTHEAEVTRPDASTVEVLDDAPREDGGHEVVVLDGTGAETVDSVTCRVVCFDTLRTRQDMACHVGIQERAPAPCNAEQHVLRPSPHEIAPLSKRLFPVEREDTKGFSAEELDCLSLALRELLNVGKAGERAAYGACEDPFRPLVDEDTCDGAGLREGAQVLDECVCGEGHEIDISALIGTLHDRNCDMTHVAGVDTDVEFGRRRTRCATVDYAPGNILCRKRLTVRRIGKRELRAAEGRTQTPFVLRRVPLAHQAVEPHPRNRQSTDAVAACVARRIVRRPPSVAFDIQRSSTAHTDDAPRTMRALHVVRKEQFRNLIVLPTRRAAQVSLMLRALLEPGIDPLAWMSTAREGDLSGVRGTIEPLARPEKMLPVQVVYLVVQVHVERNGDRAEHGGKAAHVEPPLACADNSLATHGLEPLRQTAVSRLRQPLADEFFGHSVRGEEVADVAAVLGQLPESVAEPDKGSHADLRRFQHVDAGDTRIGQRTAERFQRSMSLEGERPGPRADARGEKCVQGGGSTRRLVHAASVSRRQKFFANVQSTHRHLSPCMPVGRSVVLRVRYGLTCTIHAVALAAMGRQLNELHITCDGYQIDLYCRDCVEGLDDPAVVQPRSIDVVVTSPPYNLGVRYSRYDDTISRKDYLSWLDSVAARIAHVLSDQGSLFLNIGSKPVDPTVPFDVLEVMQRHFQLQNTIHWIKSIAIDRASIGEMNGIGNDIVVGHYKPINSKRFLNDCHEYVFHLTKTRDVPLDRLAVGVPYQDKSNVSRWRGAGDDLHCRGNVWFIPYKTISSRDRHRPHPATFPPLLPEMCMRLHGVERISQVMDPFLGIGNTALACCEMGVNFLGFEIDPEYYGQAAHALKGRCAGQSQR